MEPQQATEPSGLAWRNQSRDGAKPIYFAHNSEDKIIENVLYSKRNIRDSSDYH